MITYRCVCGRYLQVADELANCKARCPKCRAVTVVPPLAQAPGESLCPPSDGAPTVSSHHDLTIQPSESVPPRRKDKEANS
jgi:phage FluMu protein Com